MDGSRLQRTRLRRSHRIKHAVGPDGYAASRGGYPRPVGNGVRERIRADEVVRNTLSVDEVPLVGAELKQAVMRSWTAYRTLARTMKLGAEQGE